MQTPVLSWRTRNPSILGGVGTTGVSSQSRSRGRSELDLSPAGAGSVHTLETRHHRSRPLRARRLWVSISRQSGKRFCDGWMGLADQSGHRVKHWWGTRGQGPAGLWGPPPQGPRPLQASGRPWLWPFAFSFPQVCVPSHHMASWARALPLPAEAALEAGDLGAGPGFESFPSSCQCGPEQRPTV